VPRLTLAMLFSCEETQSSPPGNQSTTHMRVRSRNSARTKTSPRRVGMRGLRSRVAASSHEQFNSRLHATQCHPDYQDVTCRPAGPPWADIALPGTAKNLQQKKFLSVRQHLAHFRRVCRTHRDQFLQPPHSIGGFRPQQMPLAGMHSQNLAGFRDLESLGGSAMRFNF
jgi:hypothetical protein